MPLFNSYRQQNTDEAIAHLCDITPATHLICHQSLLSRAQQISQLNDKTCIVEMVPRCAWQDVHSTEFLLPMALSPAEETNLTALIMHTSGSTGMPKVCDALLDSLITH